MAGHSAFGTLLGVATSASVMDLSTNPACSTGWTDIVNLTNISGPSISVDTIDVTAHDSADGFREFTAGVIDGGDITLEGNFTSTGIEIKDLADLREIIGFRVRFTTTGTSPNVVNYDTWLLTGSMVSVETGAPHDGKIGFSAGVKLSGKPFLTSTYSSS